MSMIGVVVLSGCSVSSPSTDAVTQMPSSTQSRPEHVLYVFGDSLSAWYRLPIEKAYPSLVEQQLNELWYDVRVINAGESGDTSAWLLERLDWAIGDSLSWDIALVVIGGNDGLQWLSVDELESNITQIVTSLRNRWITVIVGWMQLPTNLGGDYRSEFEGVYARIARDTNAILLPSFLSGVWWIPELNLSDGIHPNETWQLILAEKVVSFLLSWWLLQ